MSFYLFSNGACQLLPTAPPQIPADAWGWWVMTREDYERQAVSVAETLQMAVGAAPIELHQQDLLNAHHPSHYDYTSLYDLVIFRHLVSGASSGQALMLPSIQTQPVGFVLYDRLLVSVHGEVGAIAEEFVRRFTSQGARKPSSSADLMLRMINAMVDSYLELRKQLSGQLDRWQFELLSPNTRHLNWRALLSTRNELHTLQDLCDEQHDAMQEWLDTLQEQALQGGGDAQLLRARHERDVLVARSRDIIEHIERVVHHVRRLEQSAETAVQIHFSAQSNRTNDIMRTLTTLTAVFLPLNLIAGIFGMNFEFLPLIHQKGGFWIALGSMGCVAIALTIFFWRKRYLARTRA